MWVKSIIEKEARKIVNHPYYSNGRLLSTTIFLYLIMVMSVLTIIEMSYDMYFVKYDFDALVREQVVEQRAFINAKSKDLKYGSRQNPDMRFRVDNMHLALI